MPFIEIKILFVFNTDQHISLPSDNCAKRKTQNRLNVNQFRKTVCTFKTKGEGKM